MSRLMIVEVPSYSYEFKGIREVRELVCCRECKHGQDDLIHMFCAYHHHKTYADDFCSYGERKGE